MWIVNLALRRPYTFVVMAILMVLLGVGAIKQTPVDIFPEIDIPVVSVIWNYQGLAAPELEKRLTIYSEFSISANVNNIKSIESQTLNGVGVIKIFFHPVAKIETALAQVTAISQAILRRMPPGVQPPIILRFNASSVPVLQLSMSSKSLSESEIYNFGIFKLRQQLAVIQGITLPAPYGGKVRQVMVDIEPEKLQARGLSAQDIANSVTAQNLTLPSGSAKIGTQDFVVTLNNSPELIESFNDMPVKTANGVTTYLRDVAHVRDGFSVQQNIVRRDGTRGILITILKGTGASTTEIVDQVKALLPTIKASAPPGLDIELLFDQSLFVRASVDGVVHESIIAAGLTGLMILLFLGSWRSTFIVTISIPLSILTSLIALSALGYTINVMTLGGLALAVGMLVDDATVEIENIHRNIGMGKKLRTAILDGAQQIAAPAFVATLTICIVFVSVIFLDGPARYLFVPMGLAVVFAMLASYLLSRTLIPVMVDYLLKEEALEHARPEAHADVKLGIFGRIHHAFNHGFELFRSAYGRVLETALAHRALTFLVFAIIVGSAIFLAPQVGRDFFPTVDAGQFRLHLKAPTGTRIEETERAFTAVEDELRKIIPPQELGLIIDNIGVPSESFNLAFGDSATLGTSDGEILVSLKKPHRPTEEYMKEIREHLHDKFPENMAYFQSSDIVSQILNFGLAAPINIRVMGFNRDQNYQIARELEERVKKVRGAVDVHLHQIVDAPNLHIEVDRARASEIGLTQRDVANSVLVALSGTTQVTPNYWLDPQMGIPYLVAVQAPQHHIDSMDALLNTSITSPSLKEPQLLANLAQVTRRTIPQSVTHSNIQPTFDIYASVQNRDLGAVADDIQKIINEVQAKLPLGTRILLRGQVEAMNTAFFRLGLGIVFAAVLVYLLMVVNFQSWSDPFIILMALPGALAGIVWMLYVSQTTFNVPSLMGTIMAVGVATANSILLVTFANEQRLSGMDSIQSALTAGITRLRPVIMTAFAMIVGMLPMAIGLGEGGEQNAPLGRAVIGGLLMATVSTLILVPVVFSIVRRSSVPHHEE